MENLHLDETFIRLVSFIREEIGEYSLDITEHFLIEDDLGVTGEDAFDLIQNFSKKFNVDIENFEYKKYFYPEPISIFDSYRSVMPFRVGNLYESIRIGKLV